MRLLIQPGDGVEPLVAGINGAHSSIKMLIFRLDRVEIETALIKAASRGVSVHALIAYTNRGGEKNLRALEMRLLEAGITVSRTADDLVRYHGKMMIIDGRELYLMAFNLTNLDIESSRSFAVVSRDKEIVQEAMKLFDADSKRSPYTPGLDTFVVSPANARKVLSDFIEGAERHLLIYDPAVVDPAMVHLLQERSKAGVEIKLLGRLSRDPGKMIAFHKLFMRLHTRAMIRDGEYVFLGSQSLRTAELDARREIGLIFRDPKIAARMTETFEDDWIESQKCEASDAVDHPPTVAKMAKKVAKTVIRALPPVTPVLEVVVREMSGKETEVDVNAEELEATVKDAVKSAIKDAVEVAVAQAVKDAR
jgi:cardiolipin synthase